MDIELIAQICHEANRIWCRGHKDFSQLPWDECATWQKDAAINNVNFIINHPDSSLKDIHDAWMDFKFKEGWRYGTEKNIEFKTHPSLIPYHELSDFEKKKDELMKAIVTALI